MTQGEHISLSFINFIISSASSNNGNVDYNCTCVRVCVYAKVVRLYESICEYESYSYVEISLRKILELSLFLFRENRNVLFTIKQINKQYLDAQGATIY